MSTINGIRVVEAKLVANWIDFTQRVAVVDNTNIGDDLVLIYNMDDPTENGLYQISVVNNIVDVIRSPDFDTSADYVAGLYVTIVNGLAFSGSLWKLDADSNFSLGADPLVFTQISVVPYDVDVIGNSGIDQTTPGVTDAVTVKASAGIGSLTEAAPGTDTASSGLNGRLQRIAQNLTTMLTGIVLAAGSAIIGKVGIDQTTPGVTDSVSVKLRSKITYTLLNAVLIDQTSAAQLVGDGRRTIQATITGTGALSATVEWFGNSTNSNVGGVPIATSTLAGVTTDTTGADLPAEWPYVYCTLSNISGTNAAVTTVVGV
jgi:hypothetical protein